MILSIVFLPFLSFVWCSLFGRFIGRLGAVQISTILMVIAHVFSLLIFITVYNQNESYYLQLISWIDCGLFYINWSFLIDPLSISMLTMVSFIASMVIIYSGGYMENDPSFIRFISYLTLFTFLMFMLITSDNFIQLFFGWEGVGLCSYLLISFWNTRVQANKAALKALIMNRIGDLGFLIGIALIYYFFRTLDFNIVFILTPLFEHATIDLMGIQTHLISLICFFLFIGSCGKSAQISLHTWLPDAMEGPTPVSALIHAATMVTAGVFLIIRSSFLFESAPTILTLITLIGVITAFFASTIGLFQFDIKKVIAYSTCSQLGYMVFICGLSQYNAAIFHLINHAFFKALLFLTAGAIIHSLAGEQDMRRMGLLLKILPSTYNNLLIGSLALAGFPYLSGYYSKDFILELSYSHIGFHSAVAFWLGTLSAFFTAFYSFRIIYLVFFSNFSSYLFYLKGIHEFCFSIGIVLNILTICSIFFGYAAKQLFIGFGSFFFAQSIYINPLQYLHLDIEFIPTFIKLLPTFATFSGIFLGVFIFFTSTKYKYSYIWIKLTIFFNNKWFFDVLYNHYIGYKFLNYSYKVIYIAFDKGILELFGVLSCTKATSNLSKFFKSTQNGLLYNYQQIFLVSCLIFILMSLYI